MKQYLLYLLLAVALLSSCRAQEGEYVVPEGQYAQGFVLTELSDGVDVRVLSPWEPGVVQAHLVVPQGKPLGRIATTSTTQVGFLHALGADSLIAGYCDAALVYNRVDGPADLGSSLSVDVERLLAADASLVLQTVYQQGDQEAAKLQSYDLQCLPINEWMEIHPLARAEWIRVVGALVGRLHEADSIFAAECAAYEALAADTATDGVRQSICSGATWQGTWYVPAGHSYMAQLFRDAGTRYAYASDSSTGSLPLSFEQALLAFREADVWVGAPTRSLDELRQQDEKHAWFAAFQQGRVYNYLGRSTAAGANDFWEMGTVHPSLILHDLKCIASEAPDSMLYFAERLK